MPIDDDKAAGFLLTPKIHVANAMISVIRGAGGAAKSCDLEATMSDDGPE